MPSTTELMQSELGKAFVDARQKAERIKMHTRPNVIGEDVVIQFNPFNQVQKGHTYAQVISDAFDKMIERTIPKDAILSAQFESWINRERNELMIDSRLNKDNYFKSQTDFATGEITENTRNDILLAKMNLLNDSLDRLSRAFTTFMEKNAEKAFANEDTLKKYEEYYSKQLQEVQRRIESGDYTAYNKTDKDGAVISQGSQEDAVRHKQNIDSILDKVEQAKAEQQARVSETQEPQTQATEQQVDYTAGSSVNFKHRP